MFIYFLSFKLRLVSIRLSLHLKCILCKIITNCHRLSPSNWTRKARIPYNKNIHRFNMFSVYIISKIFHYSRRRVQTQLFIIIYHFFCKLHTIIGNNKSIIVKAFIHRNTNILFAFHRYLWGCVETLTYYIHCSAWLILKYNFQGLKFENVILRESDI